MVVGLTLMWLLLPLNEPVFKATFNTRILWMVWLMLREMVTSLINWGGDVAVDLNNGLQIGTQAVQSIRFNLSPEITLSLMAGLSLAWLVANTMLLHRNSFTIKNGGVS
jgi:hypothetical protein